MHKSRFWANTWLHRMLSMVWLARCYQHGADGLWQVVTLIAGSKRQSLLMAGGDDEMFMTRSLHVTPKTTEQHLIAHSDKSVACVTDNERLGSIFCTLEANYWQTRSIAHPSCYSRAYLLIPVGTTGPWSKCVTRSGLGSGGQPSKIKVTRGQKIDLEAWWSFSLNPLLGWVGFLLSCYLMYIKFCICSAHL